MALKKAKYENGVSGARLFKNNRLSHAHLREKGWYISYNWMTLFCFIGQYQILTPVILIGNIYVVIVKYTPIYKKQEIF